MISKKQLNGFYDSGSQYQAAVFIASGCRTQLMRRLIAS